MQAGHCPAGTLGLDAPDVAFEVDRGAELRRGVDGEARRGAGRGGTAVPGTRM